MGIIEKIVVSDETFARLAENAKKHGRSVADEAADALRLAIAELSRQEIVARLDAVAAMTPRGVRQTDSTLLVREDRDR